MINLILSNNNLEGYTQLIKNALINLGLSESIAGGINLLALLIVYLGFLYFVAYMLLKIFPKIIDSLSKSKRVKFLKYLENTRFTKNLAYLIPLLIISRLTPKVLTLYPSISKLFVLLLNIATFFVLLSLIGSFLYGL